MNACYSEQHIQEVLLIRHKIHVESMQNPAYVLGYNSKVNKNPFKYPKQISDDRLRISIKNKLTSKDKQKLKDLNDQFFKSDWWLFGMGYRYHQKELKND